MSETARGLTLHTRDGHSFRFDPGALCLELLTTGGPGYFARFEVLHEPADLVRWAGESRLPDGLEPVVAPDEVWAARVLRDALWRLATARVDGRAPSPADLAVVNEAAAQTPPAPRITGRGGRDWVPGATGTQLLSAVARDAVDLLTGPYAHRIRECGSHNCYLLFVDTSRPGRRRWCAMERCGNRNKVRAHRVRHEGGRTMPRGLTQDAGWEIGVSRTLPLPVAAVWEFIASPEGVALWLGEGVRLPTAKGESYETGDGIAGEVRSYRPGDRVRLTYGTSTLQVAVSASGEGKAVLRFHQDRLANAEERERQRAHWKAVMGEVTDALGVA